MDLDRIIAERQVKARGWELDLHHQGDGLYTQPLYLLHVNTARLDLLTLPIALTAPPSRTLHSAVEGASMVAAAYREFTKPASKPRREKIASMLANALLQYFMATDSWQQLRQALRELPGVHVHPIFMLYGPKRDLRVRPVVGQSDHRFAEPEWILELCARVASQDRLRHPDWFR